MAYPARKKAGRAIRDKAGITIFSPKNIYSEKTRQCLISTSLPPAFLLHLPSVGSVHYLILCVSNHSFILRSKHNYFIIFKTMILRTFQKNKYENSKN
jgi:hypothetical protein